MRSEKEIKEVVRDVEITLKNLIVAYNDKELSREVFKSMMAENEGILKTLKWVLDEIE